jgi:hypothetical protein
MRDSNLKISDIKAFRAISRLLGKLGIQECINCHHEVTYGFGMKQAKDLVERTFDYQPISNSPLDQLRSNNEIHIIKRLRQTMNMLNKLGLKSPDSGLQACRGFVTRTTR